MAETDLNIILKLVDEASGKLKEALGQTTDETKKSADDTKKSTDNMNTNWTRVSVSIMGVYRALGFARKELIDILDVGRDVDPTFNKSFESFNLSIIRAKAAIAEELIPVLKTALDFWTQFLNAKFKDNGIEDYNRQLQSSERNLAILKERQEQLQRIEADRFLTSHVLSDETNAKRRAELDLIQKEIDLEEARIETINKIKTTQESGRQSETERYLQIQQAKQLLADYSKTVEETNLLYRAGMISSQEYYDIIINNEREAMMMRDQSMAQMQQLAMLQMQLSNQDFMEAQRLNQEKIALLQFYSQEYNTAHQGMAALTVALGTAIQTNLSGALVDMAMGTKSANAAFKDLGTSMVKVILDFMIQKLVASVLEKTLLAGTVAASSAAGAAVAAAWAPAAAMVSLASFGANAAPAAAAITSVNALSMGMAIGQGMANKAVNVTIDSVSSSDGVIYGGAQAEGGDYMVRRPTLFMAGEAGPERATFTPVGQETSTRGDRGNVYIDITIDRPTISKESDIDYLVETISKRFALEAERIR